MSQQRYLAAVSVVYECHADSDCLACRWEPLGWYKTEAEATHAAQAIAEKLDAPAHIVLPEHSAHPLYKRLAKRLSDSK